MDTKVEKIELDNSEAYDWFFPAITKEGTVNQCLDAVGESLQYKLEFIQSLKSCLVPNLNFQLDSISDIGRRVKVLENTLKVRLGLLRPEREGAWFRVSANSTAGPFAAEVLREPVFCQYPSDNVAKICRRLKRRWEQKLSQDLPFENNNKCLWSLLLELNEELNRIAQLPKPFENLQLDNLPLELPPKLYSKSLEAFLTNVKKEFLLVKEDLNQCYQKLLSASEKLWAWQEQQNQAKFRDYTTGGANRMREEFKKRRRRSASTTFHSTADRESMRFMGFESIPSRDLLKKKYLEMAKRLHPDRQGGSEQRFKMLTKAYSHLINLV